MSNNNKNNRPVFVPKHERRQGRQRQQGRQGETKKTYFHGAFTGGFSAGYYNTVGSKEGWKPSSMDNVNENDNSNNSSSSSREENTVDIISPQQTTTHGITASTFKRNKRRKHVKQKIEDFMDEHDHNVWGGPTAVRQEYQNHQEQQQEQYTKLPLLTGDNHGDEKDNKEDKRLSALLTVEAPSFNIGHRLLRILGWRDNNTNNSNGSDGTATAYVPTTSSHDNIIHDDNNNNNDDDDDDHLDVTTTRRRTIFSLNKKRIRKIQLQQKRVPLPHPKFDTCGLGYSPHRDAPEFQQYFEKRRKQARERAKLVTATTTTTTTSGGGDTLFNGPSTTTTGSANVYRVSNVLKSQGGGGGMFHDQDDTNHPHQRQGRKSDNNVKDDTYEDHTISYETIQDFVGTKSVGGFALRDDDDDVYDAEPLQNKALIQNLNRDEYDTELYDHHDSSDDEGDTVEKKDHSFTSKKNKTVIGNLFSAWTSTDPPQENDNNNLAPISGGGGGGVTSDGRPPLAGFVIGGSISHNTGGIRTHHDGSRNKELVRFRGPDVPLDYTVRLHEFGQDEYPDAFREISNSMQKRQQIENTHTAAMQSVSAMNTSLSLHQQQQQEQQQQRQKPLASTSFSGLAIAMKNRFTSAAHNGGGNHKNKSTSLTDEGLSTPIGLYTTKSKPNQQITNQASNESVETEKKITITRTVMTFYPEPLVSKRFGVKGFKRTHSSQEEKNVRSTESSFFNNQVLKSAMAAAAKAEKRATATTAIQTTNINEEAKLDMPDESNPTVERPSLEKLKSIFESASESDDGDNDDDLDSSNNDDDDSIKDSKSGKAMTPEKSSHAEENSIIMNNEQSVSISDGNQEKKSSTEAKLESTGNDDQNNKRLALPNTMPKDNNNYYSSSSSSSMDHRHRRRRKSRSKRKRSYSTDGDISSESENERKRRKRKHRKEKSRKDEKKKKKRKRQKSSKRT